MSSFEDQFPSLKGKSQWEEDIGFIPDEAIQEHCLDKAKVREAIEKHRVVIKLDENNNELPKEFQVPSNFVDAHKLLKELGLQ